jgi:hypothetical protein
MINRHGQIQWHHYNSQQRGVAIYFANDVTPYLTETKLSDNEGRILIVKTSLFRKEENGNDNSHTWIGTIYAPNTPTERKNFFRDTLSSLLCQIPETDRVILAGDYNNIITAKDKQGGNPNYGHEGANELLQTIGSHLLCDAWREFHPNDTGWTHSTSPINTGGGTNTTIRTRIDRIYVSGALLYEKHIQTEHIPSLHSDHFWVRLEMTFNKRPSHKSTYWKANTSILADRHSVNRIKKKLISASQTEAGNPPWTPDQKWKNIKKQYTALLKRISKELYTKRTAKYNSAKQIFHRLTLKESPTAQENQKLSCAIKTIQSIEEYTSKGQWIRSRMKQALEKDEPNPYFLNLVKKNLAKNHIPALKNTRPGMSKAEIALLPSSSDPTTMAEIAHTYYGTLFDEKETYEEDQEFFLEITKSSNTTLLDTEKESLSKPFTLAETMNAFKEAPTNKAPGGDGMPAEFYSSFPEILAPVFLEVINSLHKDSMTNLNWNHSIIRIIHKKDETNLLSNYRPVSLMQTDYKLYAKILANRLASFTRRIIHVDQQGFIPKNNIAHNAIRMQTLMDLTEIRKARAFFLSIDLEKAFDRVDHGYMMKILEAKGFPPDFLERIRWLYQHNTGTVIVNDQQTTEFIIRSGVRQGDPLSSFLFIITSEAFAEAIRRHPDYQGIRAGQTEHRIGTVADDTIFIGTTQRTLDNIKTLLVKYERASAASINDSKSKLLDIDYSQQQSNPWVSTFDPQPTNSTLKYIGTLIGKNINQEQIFKQIHQSMSAAMKPWEKRHLSFKGKRTIINTLIASLMPYQSQFHLAPKKELKAIQKDINSFMTSDKRFKAIAVDTFKHPVSEGGQGLTDIETRHHQAKIKWMLATMNKDKPLWFSAAEEVMNHLHENTLGFANKQGNTIKPEAAKASPLWVGICEAWRTLPTHLSKPEEGNVNCQELPLTAFGHRYTICDNLSNTPKELLQAFYTTVKDLGDPILPEEIADRTSITGGRPLAPIAVVQWISTIKQPLLDYSPTTTAQQAVVGRWYHHPDHRHPITKTSDNRWKTAKTPSGRNANIILPPGNEDTLTSMALLSHPTQDENSSFLGTIMDVPVYHKGNILLERPGKPPIPIGLATPSDLYWSALKLKPIKTDRFKQYHRELHINPDGHIPPFIGKHPLKVMPSNIMDFRYRVYHRATPTGYALPGAPSAKHCSPCLKINNVGIKESILHRLIDCPTITTPVWQHVEYLLNKEVSPMERLLGNRPTNELENIQDLIIGCAQWAIWTHRNDSIFKPGTSEGAPSPGKAVSITNRLIASHCTTLQMWMHELRNPSSRLFNMEKFLRYQSALGALPRVFHTLDHSKKWGDFIPRLIPPPPPTNAEETRRTPPYRPPFQPITSRSRGEVADTHNDHPPSAPGVPTPRE